MEEKPKAAPRPRTGGRSARVVAAVLDATLACLCEGGYESLAIGEVARRAKVHETSIYRRWQNKARLVTEAVIRSAAHTTPVPNSGAFRTDAQLYLQRVLMRLSTPVGHAMAEVVTSQGLELAEVRRAYWTSRLQAVNTIVERAKARGELPASIDSRFVMELLAGPLILRRMAGERATRTYVKRIVEIICRAIRIEKPRPPAPRRRRRS
jgi:AcrR family transcriptional regulator